ncbi:MAG: hypothetical protein AAGI69_08060 [Cyanobacteria bacterium P01_H01_bin.21]
MQGLKKASETINRGITAVAMTVAIATIYAAMGSDAQVASGNTLRYQIQAVFKLPQYEEQITQNPQESLATLLLSSRSNVYGHQ